nr:hypothetical protein CFP56_78686 [Quercus suber]
MTCLNKLSCDLFVSIPDRVVAGNDLTADGNQSMLLCYILYKLDHASLLYMFWMAEDPHILIYSQTFSEYHQLGSLPASRSENSNLPPRASISLFYGCSTIGAGTSVRSSSYVQHEEMSAAGYHGVCCPTREVPNTLLARAPLDLIQPLSLLCYGEHTDGIRRSADLRTNGIDRTCIAWPSLDDLGSVVLIRAHYIDDPEVSNFGDR